MGNSIIELMMLISGVKDTKNAIMKINGTQLPNFGPFEKYVLTISDIIPHEKFEKRLTKSSKIQ